LILVAAGALQGIGVWTLYRALRGSKASLVAAIVASSPLLTLIVEGFFIGVQLGALQWSGFTVVLAAAVWLAMSDNGPEKEHIEPGKGRR